MGRDIGPIPAPENPERRARACGDFRYFCETYFPARFHLPWSDDHLQRLATVERAVKQGGLFAWGDPRGGGKSSICVAGVLFAILPGYSPYVVLIGSDNDSALDRLHDIQFEMSANDRLAADFPDACYPIRRLERQARRCVGQLCDGKPTYILWAADRLALPMVDGSPSAGALIRVSGIEGGVRGAVYTRPDGRVVRPSLVFIDDPQTDESARSLSQCQTRERIIDGALLNLSGPDRPLTALMPCTVIRKGDMADGYLDRGKHPEWQGVRGKMLYSFPSDMGLWDTYALMRRESLAAGGDGADATAFYAANRTAMDAGARVSWEYRKRPDELSALQHAMNLYYRAPSAFMAEYQNEPLADGPAAVALLQPDDLAKRLSHRNPCVVPPSATVLTAHIDIHDELLYGMLVAWVPGFSGEIIAYTTEPDQGLSYFCKRDARNTLAAVGAKLGVVGGRDAMIFAGLERLTEALLDRAYPIETGGETRVSRCLVDAQWQQAKDVVYEFCRRSKFAPILTPSHGRYVGPSEMPLGDTGRKPGERIGLNWRWGPAPGKPIRRVLYDANYWKSHAADRLKVAPGDPGGVLLCGKSAARHRLLCEHLTSEMPIPTEARGRTVDVWKDRAPGLDNHWWDNFVACCVAASMEGIALAAQAAPKVAIPARESVRWSEVQRQKQRNR